jgi:hypothetical protein
LNEGDGCQDIRRRLDRRPYNLEHFARKYRGGPPGDQTSRGLIEATLLRTRNGVARGTGLKITPNKHAAKNHKH